MKQMSLFEHVEANPLYKDDTPVVMTFETYAVLHGHSRFVRDIATDRLPGVSLGQKERVVKRQQEIVESNFRRRCELREEFQWLIDNGVARKPTRSERLIDIASGHPDNPSVQAAKRVLVKRFT